MKNKSESRYPLNVISREALENYPWVGEGVLEASSYKCVVFLQILTLKYFTPTGVFTVSLDSAYY